MSKLKSCPFCGYQPEAEWVQHNSIKPDSVLIYCCYVSIEAADEDKAAEIWNTRAKPEPKHNPEYNNTPCLKMKIPE